MTSQRPGADRDGEPVIAALDGYRRAVRAVASPVPAASVRARAERRTARTRMLTALGAAAAVLAIVGGIAIAGGFPGVKGAVNREASAGGPLPCRSADLFPRLGRPTIAGTQASAPIELINVGAPCTVTGHIGLSFRSTADVALVTSIQPQPGPTPPVAIATGDSAVATIAWSWSDGTETRCPTATAVAITAPGDTVAVTAPWVAGDAGLVCPGTIRLSPVTR